MFFSAPVDGQGGLAADRAAALRQPVALADAQRRCARASRQRIHQDGGACLKADGRRRRNHAELSRRLLRIYCPAAARLPRRVPRQLQVHAAARRQRAGAARLGAKQPRQAPAL